MSAGNGTVLAAIHADDEHTRLLLNGLMVERGLTKYLISKEAWATRLRPHDSIVAAIRRGWPSQEPSREPSQEDE